MKDEPEEAKPTEKGSGLGDFWRWLRARSMHAAITLLAAIALMSNLDGSWSFVRRLPTPQNVAPAAYYFVHIAFLISAGFLVFLGYRLTDLRTRLKAERKSEEEFRMLAHQNALLDYMISAALLDYIDKDAEEQKRANQLRLSRAMEANIQKILDHSARVFEDFTNAKCATSLRLFTKDRAGDIVAHSPLMRDEYSRLYRKNVLGDSTSISENTANITVLVLKRRYYACNDLLDARSKGDYVNNRRGWENDYNSTIVFGIPFPPGQSGRVPYLGLFCVDSLDGKLNNKPCINCAEELSWRLSVLILALNRMDLDPATTY